MAQYATASELAGYMQQDLDTYTANLVLTLASGEFTKAAGTAFSPTSVTYTRTGTCATSLTLPYRAITAVTDVRVNGVSVTGWSLIGSVLYRTSGFGTTYAYATVPDVLEADLTHGYATVPDDVKAAVLETAAMAYANPTGVTQEAIDDYSVRYGSTPAGVRLSSAAADLARDYRGPVFA